MIRVLLLVPVLGRPDRPAEFVASVAASYSGRLFSLETLFLVSPGDEAQEAACRLEAAASPETVAAHVVGWQADVGDYARKINEGWRIALGDSYAFVFLGADDLDFHPGWIEQAVSVQLDTGACVVGINDLGAPGTARGTAATHSLVSVDYTCGLIDDPDQGKILYEGYDHSFVDNEFVGTAMSRGVFGHAPFSHVEHLHPIHRKSEVDATYEKGQRAFAQDRDLHNARRPLWAPEGTVR